MKRSECETRVKKILDKVIYELPDLPLETCRNTIAFEITSFIHSEFGLDPD